MVSLGGDPGEEMRVETKKMPDRRLARILWINLTYLRYPYSVSVNSFVLQRQIGALISFVMVNQISLFF